MGDRWLTAQLCSAAIAAVAAQPAAANTTATATAGDIPLGPSIHDAFTVIDRWPGLLVQLDLISTCADKTA